MASHADDFRFAKATGMCVEVVLISGDKVPITGVYEVDETENFVSLFKPQVFGDDTTRQRIALDTVSSVTVTDVEWE